MASFKKLSKSDVTFVPYYANKQWNLSYCPYPTSSEYLTIYNGTNLTGSFSSDEPITEGQYDRLVYSQINQLFYQKYTTPLNTSSLANSIYYESASQQRPTQSYFIYNDSARLVENFPTGAMEGIRVLAVNQDIYGDKVLPNHFQLSSSAYNIIDDGYGNLYDYSSSITHVGNLFYAHGLGIITNQDYQYIFPLPPIAKNDYGSFLTTDSPKTISASLNDYARSGTLNTSSLAFSGSTSGPGYSWATGSNGTIVLTSTIAGTYSVYYTIGADIAGSCAVQLRSNKAKVTAVITESTTTTTSTTTSTTTAPTTTTTSTTTSTTTAPTTTTTTTTSTTTSTTTATPTTTTSTTTSTTTAPTTTTTTTSTTTTTTTCAPQNAQSMYYNYDTGLPTMFGTSSADAACNLLVSASTVYYSSSLALTNGTPLYYNECLTIPITASAYTTASQQYFKIGPYYVNFETNGYVVRDITVCTPPTTNIEWRVSGSAGGTLIIKDVNEVIKVNQNSANSSGLGFSGSFTLTNSETPYSVTASINAGLPTLRYRICNLSTNSEYLYSGDITTANAPYSSSVNPTPVSSSVFLTVGSNNTPDACPSA